jgi:hypothetical protein
VSFRYIGRECRYPEAPIEQYKYWRRGGKSNFGYVEKEQDDTYFTTQQQHNRIQRMYMYPLHRRHALESQIEKKN